MPIGVIINSLSVVIGGIVGGLLGNVFSTSFKDKLNMTFGACSMSLGISSIILMENMPAVIFSVILGTTIGILIHLEEKINKCGALMQKGISKIIKSGPKDMPEEEFITMLVTIIVLFCASGTGIYGSLVSGLEGNHSILIAKSVLDLFTALIFACTLGYVVSLIAIPQFIIFFALFLLAGVIFPLTTPAMINDFKACGGVMMLATGFRIASIKKFPTADMLPSMVIVMPISYLWVTYILPLVS